MIAAASCGGATDRITSAVVSLPAGRASDHNPSTAISTATQTQSTPAMSMEPQYEAGFGLARALLGGLARQRLRRSDGCRWRCGAGLEPRVGWIPAGLPGTR